jgi:hypothetical protein
LKVEEFGNAGMLLEEHLGKPLRSYDRIINLAHFHPSSQRLFLSFINLQHFIMLDTSSRKLVWALPALGGEIPLCALSDHDKLVVCYDSNHVQVFDLLNKRLHDWSRRNGPERFPQNFLTRYNRMVGLT